MILLADILNELVEDYPASWDIGKFSKLQGFERREKYAEKHLEVINWGSGRHVFGIDDEKVLKLSVNKKGVAQTLVEIKYGKNSKYDIVAKVFEHHPKGLWAEMERAKIYSDDVFDGIFEKMWRIDFYHFGYALQAFEDLEINGKEDSYWSRALLDLDEIQATQIYTDVTEFMKDHKVHAKDLGRSSSYGVVKRDGSDKIVIIDYGMTHNVYKSYYE